MSKKAVQEDRRKVVGEAGTRRRTAFFCAPKKKKVFGSRKKDSLQKSGMRILGERVERYDLFNSLVCTPAGITPGQIVNGDVDCVKKELHKIFANNTKRTSMNVAGEGDRGASYPKRRQIVELATYSEAVKVFWTLWISCMIFKKINPTSKDWDYLRRRDV